MSKVYTTAVHVRWSDPVGLRNRGRIELQAVTPSNRGVRAFVRHVMEREGSGRPACVTKQIRFMIAEDNES